MNRATGAIWRGFLELMIYEYRCSSCGHIQEVWQKMSDPGPETCEKCAAPAPEKIISRTSFALRGDGWYATDYKKAPNAGSESKKSGGESGS